MALTAAQIIDARLSGSTLPATPSATKNPAVKASSSSVAGQTAAQIIEARLTGNTVAGKPAAKPAVHPATPAAAKAPARPVTPTPTVNYPVSAQAHMSRAKLGRLRTTQMSYQEQLARIKAENPDGTSYEAANAGVVKRQIVGDLIKAYHHAATTNDYQHAITYMNQIRLHTGVTMALPPAMKQVLNRTHEGRAFINAVDKERAEEHAVPSLHPTMRAATPWETSIPPAESIKRQNAINAYRAAHPNGKPVDNNMFHAIGNAFMRGDFKMANDANRAADSVLGEIIPNYTRNNRGLAAKELANSEFFQKQYTNPQEGKGTLPLVGAGVEMGVRYLPMVAASLLTDGAAEAGPFAEAINTIGTTGINMGAGAVQGAVSGSRDELIAQLQKVGIDTSNTAAMVKAFNTPSVIQPAMEKAEVAGAVQAAMFAVLSGVHLGKDKPSNIGDVARTVGLNSAKNALLMGGGELARQKSVGDPIDLNAAGKSALYGVGFAGMEGIIPALGLIGKAKAPIPTEARPQAPETDRSILTPKARMTAKEELAEINKGFGRKRGSSARGRVNGKPTTAVPEHGAAGEQNPNTPSATGAGAPRQAGAGVSGGAAARPGGKAGEGRGVGQATRRVDQAGGEKVTASEPADEVDNDGVRVTPKGAADGEVGKTKTQPPGTSTGAVGQLPAGKGAVDEVVQQVQVFGSEYVKPKLQQAAADIVQTTQDVSALLSPGSQKPAPFAARSLRAHLGGLAASTARAYNAFAGVRKMFDRKPEAANFDFLYKMETGKAQTNPELTRTAAIFRKAIDEHRDAIQALGTGKLQSFIENYVGHLWEDPKKANIWMKVFGRRPLEGSKNFLKARTIPTYKEGMSWRTYRADGTLRTFPDETAARAFQAKNPTAELYEPLRPVSTNPAELVLLQLHEMDKYLMSQRFLGEIKKAGFLPFVHSGRATPEGMAAINDVFATVYGPRDAEGNTVIRGKYVAPKAVANLINNYLSPGYRGKAWYRTARASGNLLNQVQLGMSAFHAQTSAFNSMMSMFALGFRQATSIRGQRVEGLRNMAMGATPYAPIRDFMLGGKILKEFYTPGSQGEEFKGVVNSIIMAGGRVSQDKEYETGAIDSFLKAFRANRKIEASIRAPFALIELGAKPMMQHVVPRLKLAAFSDMASSDLRKLGPEATIDMQREVLQKAWDSIDNRFGQLVYDNLFWNRSHKDLAMLSTRSLGWNLGTIRELGGAGVDIGQQVARGADEAYQGAKTGRASFTTPEVTHRMAYAVALPFIAGLYGAIYQYLHTGKGPQELRDYFQPLNGSTEADGTQGRTVLATYMKDMPGYVHHPITTIKNKANPLATAIADMVTNRDYYGTEIRNADDPLVKQVGDEFAYAAKQFVPFSVQGGMKNADSEGGVERNIEPFFGFTPASKTAMTTRAEDLASTYTRANAPAGTRAQADAQKGRLKSQLTALARGASKFPEGSAGFNAANKQFSDLLVKHPEITNQEVALIKKNSTMTPLQRAVGDSRLSLRKASDIYRAGTKDEKASLNDLVFTKFNKEYLKAQAAGDQRGMDDLQRDYDALHIPEK